MHFFTPKKTIRAIKIKPTTPPTLAPIMSGKLDEEGTVVGSSVVVIFIRVVTVVLDVVLVVVEVVVKVVVEVVVGTSIKGKHFF